MSMDWILFKFDAPIATFATKEEAEVCRNVLCDYYWPAAFSIGQSTEKSESEVLPDSKDA